MKKTLANIPYLGALIRPRGRSFMAEVNHDYARHRKTFKTVAEAKSWIDKLQAQILNAGTPLTNRELADASDTVRRLPAGVSLRDLLEFWERNHVAVDRSITMEKLVSTYIEEKQRANRRPRTIGDLRSRLGIVVRDLGQIPAAEVATKTLVEWLDRKGYVGTTRHNFRTVLVGLFNYAKGLSLLTGNPAEGLHRQTSDDTMPQIFTVEQATALLHATERTWRDLVPWVAIGLFAGLRTAELFQLRWENVDLKSRLITVRPETAKRRRQRHVAISDNLAEWLTDYALGTGLVAPGESLVRKRLKGKTGILMAANITQWPHNAMRHSFGSYHLAQFQDAPRTAFEMGHTTPDVLYTNYRNLVRPEEAAAYWSIRPKTPARVVSIAATA